MPFTGYPDSTLHGSVHGFEYRYDFFFLIEFTLVRIFFFFFFGFRWKVRLLLETCKVQFFDWFWGQEFWIIMWNEKYIYIYMYVFWRIVAIIYILQFRTEIEDVTILVEILENRFENEMGRKRKNRSIKIYLGIGKILYIFFLFSCDESGCKNWPSR